MLQLELYVADVEKTATLFTNVFGLISLTESPGWQHLHHADNYDIMLFDPARHPPENSHWPLPVNRQGGAGIEIVIVTSSIIEKREAVLALGNRCSDLRYPPWGSIEFTFQLQEGYLLRIKQLPAT